MIFNKKFFTKSKKFIMNKLIMRRKTCKKLWLEGKTRSNKTCKNRNTMQQVLQWLRVLAYYLNKVLLAGSCVGMMKPPLT